VVLHEVVHARGGAQGWCMRVVHRGGVCTGGGAKKGFVHHRIVGVPL